MIHRVQDLSKNKTRAYRLVNEVRLNFWYNLDKLERNLHHLVLIVLNSETIQ